MPPPGAFDDKIELAHLAVSKKVEVQIGSRMAQAVGGEFLGGVVLSRGPLDVPQLRPVSVNEELQRRNDLGAPLHLVDEHHGVVGSEGRIGNLQSY